MGLTPGKFLRAVNIAGVIVLVFSVFAYCAPLFLSITYEYVRNDEPSPEPFPVTVDPRNRVIVENAKVNELLEREQSPFVASAAAAGSIVRELFERFATTIDSLPIYQNLAATSMRLVRITPGMRKEQAAAAFGNALGWTDAEKKRFLSPAGATSTLPHIEGTFAPGIYTIEEGTSPDAAQALVSQKFTEDVLVRYGTSTASVVPLKQALTVASLIEREAGGPRDRRQISGIIWKRLFMNMNLQIDATVQYAKANRPLTVSWWPRIVPGDMSINSPYNTYLHRGLPPNPIANPSVASIIAALNPIDTPCLFYFHDSRGSFYCSRTYDEHVAQLKKIYGRGK
jgi:uncharacterized YceG family protein